MDPQTATTAQAGLSMDITGIIAIGISIISLCISLFKNRFKIEIHNPYFSVLPKSIVVDFVLINKSGEAVSVIEILAKNKKQMARADRLPYNLMSVTSSKTGYQDVRSTEFPLLLPPYGSQRITARFDREQIQLVLNKKFQDLLGQSSPIHSSESLLLVCRTSRKEVQLRADCEVVHPNFFQPLVVNRKAC